MIFDEEKDDFEEMSKLVRMAATLLIRKHFGDRCPDYEESCECCRRWKLLDDLLENVYL